MKFVLVLGFVAAVAASSSYWSGAQTQKNDFGISAGSVSPSYSAISADPSSNRMKYLGWHVEGENAFILGYTPWCTPAETSNRQNCAIFPFYLALPSTAGANAPGGFLNVLRLTGEYNWPHDKQVVYADVGAEINWVDGHGDYRSTLYTVDSEFNLYSWQCPQEAANQSPTLMGWDSCNVYVLQANNALVVSSGGGGLNGYAYCNAAYIDTQYNLWYGGQNLGTNYPVPSVTSELCAWAQVSSSVGNNTVGFHSVANGVDVVFAIDQSGNIRSTPVIANAASLPSWDTWTDITSQWTSEQQATYGNLFFVDSYDSSRTYFVANNPSGTPQNTLWRYDSGAGTFNGPIQVGGSGVDTGVGPAPNTDPAKASAPFANSFSVAATSLWNPNWTGTSTKAPFNVGNAAISVGPDAVYVSDLNGDATNLGDTWRYAHGAPF